MFIAIDEKGFAYREGLKTNEKHFTWLDIPKDAKLVQVQVTFPFKVKLLEKDGKRAREFAPLVNLGRFDQYYFMNEGTARQTERGVEYSLEAKIIGGIDLKLHSVIELKVDKMGNISLRRASLKSLNEKIEKGLFDQSIIRQGA